MVTVARYLTLLCAFLGLFTAEVSAATCSGSAYYTLTFYSNWSNITHPNAYPIKPPAPVDGFFSQLTGCSHKAGYSIFDSSIKATPGVELLAETGNNSLLMKEIQANAMAYSFFNASGPLMPTGTTDNITIHVNSEFTLVSAIAMIAPSPDWFIGIMSFDVCNSNGTWKDAYNMTDLQPWDAGTENGTELNTTNFPTNPPVKMFQITSDMETPFRVFKPNSIPTLGSIMLKLTMTKPPPDPSQAAHCPSGGLLAFVSIAFVAVFRAIF